MGPAPTGSDLRMPSGDGIDLLKQIVALKAPRPAVILMTGFSDLNSEQARAMGLMPRRS